MADTNSTHPLVSVIVPVLHGDYLTQALDSIVGQTYTNWELVLVDDGANEQTKAIINSYATKESRVRVITHATNQGIVLSLNEAVAQSNGTYIARMDADDVSAPDRLTRQVAFLQTHPDVHVVGGAVLMFSETNPQGRMVEVSTEVPEVHATMFWNCCLVHPAVLCRRSILQNIAYEEQYRYSEDYRVWLRAVLSSEYKLANLPRPAILSLRKHGSNSSQQHRALQRERATTALAEAWERITGVDRDTAVSYATAFYSPQLPQVSATLMTMCDALTALEAGLMRQTHWSPKDNSAITEIITRKMGEIATVDFMLCGGNASQSKAWRAWLARNPAQQMATLMSHMSTMSNPASSASTRHEKPGFTPSPPVALGTERLTIICFSKDRAFQLKEYLRTLFMYAAKTVELKVHVLWTASTPEFNESYMTLSKQFEGVNFVCETNFAKQLQELVEQAESFILWGVDDVLYYAPVDFKESMQSIKEQEEILCAHFRLSPNVNYCHPSDAYAKLPPFHPVRQDAPGATMLKYNRFETDQDWNYPFELCATLMRKNDVIDTLKLIEIHFGTEGVSHPNKLEVCGSKLFTRKLHPKHQTKWCLCMQKPIMSVITINRVQDICKNRVYDEISLEELDQYFRQNKEMDLEYYQKTTFNAVHIGDFILKGDAK